MFQKLLSVFQKKEVVISTEKQIQKKPKTYTLSKWLVKNNQTIKTGEIIAEIETDKAVFEFESFNSGKIEIIAKEKDNLKVGDLLAKVRLEDNTETIITAPDLTKH